MRDQEGIDLSLNATLEDFAKEGVRHPELSKAIFRLVRAVFANPEEVDIKALAVDAMEKTEPGKGYFADHD